ncbi:CPBP family intramembrane glutamic endopeptidase [Nocardiopsis sp. MG754419]|uniref:CPBP family intramembrane glutamic endopeptidase n=1 Tax=Nocardiopsis sp. MG754419 TaxID=2259865 RepID=UPI0027DAD486|nr:CPBP family intramembrane glutamic endopeptidase [Nocardiopsis sp. MG754419]MBR8741740.1 CPBP family intramembrane metalloprotease domain-containing protein [Nocardiopsis sp. MG754419]
MRTNEFARSEIPEGESYHRLAHTPLYRWWVPLLAVTVFAVLLFFLWVGVMVVMTIVAILGGSGLALDSVRLGEVAGLAFGLASIALLTPLAFFVTRVVQWRRTGSLVSVTGRVRWRWLGGCLLIALALALLCALLVPLLPGAAAATAAVEAEPAGTRGGIQVLLAAMTVIVLLVPLQSAAEELTMRGLVMQLVGSLGSSDGRSAFSRVMRSPWPAILAGGTLFAALFGATHPGQLWTTASLVVLGLGMAWVTWRTGGLEAAIGLHMVNSLFQFTRCVLEGRLSEVGTGIVLGAGLPMGTDTPLTLVVTTVQVGLYTFLVARVASRRGVLRRSPVRS